MHTGAKLSGAVCKCLDCARQRQDTLRREARIRYRDEYNQIAEQRDDAVLAQQAAVADLRAAVDRMRELTERVRKELT